MVGEVMNNLTNNFMNITDINSLQSSLSSLVTIFQILGGVIIFYIIYWTVMTYINFRKAKILNKILKRLDYISEELMTSQKLAKAKFNLIKSKKQSKIRKKSVKSKK